MSGEIILLGGTTLGGVVAAPLLAGAAYLLAQAWVEQRRQEAEQQRQAEMARTTVWQVHCQTRDQELATEAERIRAIQGHLQALQQAATAIQTHAPANTVAHQGFLETSSARLAELGVWLDQLPQTVVHEPGFPGAALRRQQQRLAAQAAAGQPPDSATLDAVREGMERTLAHFLAGLERQQTIRRERRTRTEILLNRVLTLGHLTGDTLQIEAKALRHDLMATLERGSLSAKDFDTLERQVLALEQRNEEQLTRAATRHAMMTSVNRHLAELGYRSLTQTGDHQAEWAVPGGERLRLSIGKDFQLAFRLVHERPLGVTGALGVAELNRVRHQEARWCHDARTLLRSLIKDGIDLRVAFEAEVPEAQLPLVVVERPEDWQEDETERHERVTRRGARALDGPL